MTNALQEEILKLKDNKNAINITSGWKYLTTKNIEANTINEYKWNFFLLRHFFLKKNIKIIAKTEYKSDK